MLHSIISIRSLPPETRRAWQSLFEHYVFGDNTTAIEHIPPNRRGILGQLSLEQIAALRAHLAKRLA